MHIVDTWMCDTSAHMSPTLKQKFVVQSFKCSLKYSFSMYTGNTSCAAVVQYIETNLGGTFWSEDTYLQT